MSKKSIVSVIGLFVLLLVLAANVLGGKEVMGYDIEQGIDKPIIRYVKSLSGDKICFEIVVKEGTSSILYRTIGWIVDINGNKIIYKYPEIPEYDFTFNMYEIEYEFKRQYKADSQEYKEVREALCEEGGTITFNAINTIVVKGKPQGSIIENPVYLNGNAYNYSGKVYDNLKDIQNAAGWGDIVKNKDLPKYFDISYDFSKQPSSQGEIIIKYTDVDGKSIIEDDSLKYTFLNNSYYEHKGYIKHISGYKFKKWEYKKENHTIEEGIDKEYVCILNKDITKGVLYVIYERENYYSDLYIKDITPEEHRENTNVLSVITVGNSGITDYTPDKSVQVKFTVNNTNYFQDISIGSGKEIIVPFKWKTPGEGTAVIKAEINFDKKYYEDNYGNNEMEKSVYIMPYKTEYIGETLKTDIIDIPEIETKNYYEWKEWRFEGYDKNGEAIYKEKTFWVRLNIEAQTDKINLKSGYGFSLDVLTSITTNYDKEEYIIQPQRVQNYTPETKYLKFFEMDIISGRDSMITNWQLPQNRKSVYKYRKHYVPIWFPDKKYYRMSIIADDAYCPAGLLNSTVSASVYINGNMYEDDVNRNFL